MTITEPYTAAAFQARQATEKSVEAWRNAAKTVTNQLDRVRFPIIDLTKPVSRYFEYLQRAVDFNRDLATNWAQLITTLSGSLPELTEKVTGIVKDHTDTIADLAVTQAGKAEQLAKEQAERVEQGKRSREAKIEETEKDQAQARAAEREHAKKDASGPGGRITG